MHIVNMKQRIFVPFIVKVNKRGRYNWMYEKELASCPWELIHFYSNISLNKANLYSLNFN